MTKYIYALDEVCKAEIVGPVVICCIKIEQNLEIPFFKDSKKKRKIDFENLEKLINSEKLKYEIFKILPNELTEKSNLNTLITNAQKKLISTSKPQDIIYVDCHLLYPNKLYEQLKKVTPSELYVKHKYDEQNKYVALASLVATLQKHKIYAEIYKTTGLDPGSGNVNDEKTKTYLKKTKYMVKSKWKIKNGY